MKENVMYVCARRDATNVSIYEVETNESNEVKHVLLLEMNEFGMKQSSLVQLIKNTCNTENIIGCIIDTMSSGIMIADALVQDITFTTPIYRIRYALSQEMNRCTVKLMNYIKENKLHISREIDLDLSKIEYKTSANGMVSLKENDIRIGDLASFIGNVETYKVNIKKEENRTKIERNLREIVEILVDDLYALDKKNSDEVNNLVRLIDKVNYIRGQY